MRRRSGTAGAILATALLAGACGGDDEVVALDEGDPGSGRELYAVHCVACHGEEGLGSAAGPPLITELYAPPNLSDEAVATAITDGVPQEEWNFGPMPGNPGLSSRDVADLVAFVRELQREAGLLE